MLTYLQGESGVCIYAVKDESWSANKVGFDPGQRHISILTMGMHGMKGIDPLTMLHEMYRAIQRHVRNESPFGAKRAYRPHLHTTYTGKHSYHRMINSRIIYKS